MAQSTTVSIYRPDDHVSPARVCLGGTAVLLAWTALFTNIVVFVVVITTHGQHDHVLAAIVFLLLAVTILCATVGGMLLHPAESF